MTTDTLRNPNPMPLPKHVPKDDVARNAEPTPTESRDKARPAAANRMRLGGALVLLAGVTALFVALGLWWSQQPAKFDVAGNARDMVGSEPESGVTTTATAIRVAETLLGKPGGYLHNDVLPPGVLMDNMPSWEYGVLTELRDSVRSLRNDFSRSQTQSLENQDLQQADAELNFDAKAWFLPSSEEGYRQGIEALRRYLENLQSRSDPGARFFSRADNLSAYLAVVEKRLGSYGQRLAASVGDAELTLALTGVGGDAPQASARTDWGEVDDIFFEARGYSWALLHMMKALSVDFADVLRDKNAEVSMQQVIRDLEYATRRKWSPIVVNGHGFGVLANHSLVLASYIARTNAAVLDLRALLQRG